MTVTVGCQAGKSDSWREGSEFTIRIWRDLKQATTRNQLQRSCIELLKRWIWNRKTCLLSPDTRPRMCFRASHLTCARNTTLAIKPAELMCDYFAACLLMPRPWVKRLWAQGVQDTAVLAATFNVSPAAMNVRVQQLGLVEPRDRWHRGRPSVRTYFRTAPAVPVAVA